MADFLSRDSNVSSNETSAAEQSMREGHSNDFWTKRLVWHEYKVVNGNDSQEWKILWPAVVYEDLQEFDQLSQPEATQTKDFAFRSALALEILATHQQQAQAVKRVIRYLGRPLGDFQIVSGDVFLGFFDHLSSQLMNLLKPERFQGQSYQLYMDYHNAMDLSMKLFGNSDSARTNGIVPYTVKAEKAWKEAPPQLQLEQPQRQLTVANPGPNVDQIAARASQPPGAASPMASVAAVSIDQESATTPATTAESSTAESSVVERKQSSANFPHLRQSLGAKPWNKVKPMLLCSGWMTYMLDSNEKRFYVQSSDTEYSEYEFQQIAKEHYGWKPKRSDMLRPPNQRKTRSDSLSTPQQPATRNTRQRHRTPAEHAKIISFSFLWECHLKRQGWTRCVPNREHSHLADWYYLKPGFTKQNPGILNQDFFLDHNEIVAYCQRTNEYPSSSDESSVAESPRELVQEVLSMTPETPEARTPKKTPKTRRNYTFGVLWAMHLQPQGWTAETGTGLVDWFYVRPRRSRKGGQLGVDYFQSAEEVLAYCEEHGDYPASSSSGSSVDETTATGMDEESTKVPAETDDEHTVQTNDDSTVTPDRRPLPQDPGKPILSDSDGGDSDDDASRESHYDWINLWPLLKKRGWSHIKAQNKLDDWWYLPPTGSTLFDEKPNELIRGKHYFATEEEVIEHIRQLDERDQTDQERRRKLRKSQERVAREAKGAAPANKRVRKASASPSRSARDTKPKRSVAKKQKRASKERKITTKTKELSEEEFFKMTKVEVDPETNEAPWRKQPLPRNKLHDLCVRVAGLTYQSYAYFLHGDNSKDAKIRFDNLEDFRKYYCRLGRDKYFVVDSSEDIQQSELDHFHRWVNHAMVPGSQATHDQLRGLTPTEVVQVLKFLGFQASQGAWCPSSGLASDDNLKASYESWAALCRDLRGVEDLAGKNTDSARPSRRAGMTQKKDWHEKRALVLMAFRLSIADGYYAEEPASKESKKRRRSQSLDDSVFDFSKDCDNQKQPSKNTKKNHGSESSKKGKRSKVQSPRSSQKEVSIADLKVKAQEGKETAWELEERSNLWPLAQQLGVTYSGGLYSIPLEFGAHPRFTSVDELIRHWITFLGECLDNISPDDQSKLEVLLRYAHVPCSPHEYRKYRLLKDVEAARLLNVLGFQENQGIWEVPEFLLTMKNPYQTGYPSILSPTFASLSELRCALRRMPSLEKTERRGRKKESCFSEHLMAALRLWIAYDPKAAVAPPKDEQSEERVVSDTEDVKSDKRAASDPKKESGGKKKSKNSKTQSIDSTSKDREPQQRNDNSKILSQLSGKICSHRAALDLLVKAGCRITNRYFIPWENSEKSFDSQNDMVQFILDESICNVGAEGKLTREELETLHRYLVYKNVKLNSFSPIGQAMQLLADGNLETLINKVGFVRHSSADGLYTLDPEKYEGHSVDFDIAELVNAIRAAQDSADLAGLAAKVLAKRMSGEQHWYSSSRRRSRPTSDSLSAEEELALRYWAAEAAYPLSFFDIDGLCKENVCEEDEEEPDDLSKSSPPEKEESLSNNSPAKVGGVAPAHEDDVEQYHTPLESPALEKDEESQDDHSKSDVLAGSAEGANRTSLLVRHIEVESDNDSEQSHVGKIPAGSGKSSFLTQDFAESPSQDSILPSDFEDAFPGQTIDDAFNTAIETMDTPNAERPTNENRFQGMEPTFSPILMTQAD